MSASSVARKASKGMLGSVCESGKLWPASTWPLPSPGLDLDGHVVEVGFRPQQQRRVGVDQVQVLRLDVHADHRVAVFEVDRGDLADLDAGDDHRLALARRDGLRVVEVRRQVDEVFADERRPGGQRRFLLGEDPQRHRDRGERQDGDRDRVFAAPPRLPREGGAEVPPATGLRGCSLMARQVGGADLAERAVDVGDRVACRSGRPASSAAGRRAAAARRAAVRPCAPSPASSVLRLPFGLSCSTRASPPPGWSAQVGAVAVEVLAPAGEVGEGVEELAVVGAAGAEAVFDRLVRRSGR